MRTFIAAHLFGTVVGTIGLVASSAASAMTVAATSGEGAGGALITGGPYAVVIAILAVIGKMLKDGTLVLAQPAKVNEALLTLAREGAEREKATAEALAALANLIEQGHLREEAFLEAFWTLDIVQGLRPQAPPNRRRRVTPPPTKPERRRSTDG